MGPLTRLALPILKDEGGPTAFEYAVLLALIALVCVTSIAGMGSNSNKTFGPVGVSDRSTLSRGLRRATKQGVICCGGSGYRGNPFRYWLRRLPWMRGH
jgi:Flp pilus assembly pilin Flp